MHESVMQWVSGWAINASGVDSLLEVGSYDVNGSVRGLFDVERYVGIDIAPGPGVDVVVTPRSYFPFGSDEFDVVVSTSTFEHVMWPWFTLSEMRRCVCPGGLVLVTVAGWRRTDDPEAGDVVCFGFHNPPDLWRFNDGAMYALADYAGLDVVEVSPDPQVAGWFMACRKP